MKKYKARVYGVFEETQHEQVLQFDPKQHYPFYQKAGLRGQPDGVALLREVEEGGTKVVYAEVTLNAGRENLEDVIPHIGATIGGIVLSVDNIQKADPDKGVPEKLRITAKADCVIGNFNGLPEDKFKEVTD